MEDHLIQGALEILGEDAFEDINEAASRKGTFYRFEVLLCPNSNLFFLLTFVSIVCVPESVPPIPYYWTGFLILEHSYLVGNLTISKIAEIKVLEPLKS
jgi:hypothetical protein